MNHHDIAHRFNVRFARRARTLLIGGAEEPLYLPATEMRPAIIRYTRDYAQSALHEIAHWCLAGVERLRRVDYGYWYQPPPRSAEDQARFFAVEARVQGLELLLARVCGVRFHVSADSPGSDFSRFEAEVQAQAVARLVRGPRGRAAAVLAAFDPGWRERLAGEPDLAPPSEA